MSFKRNNMAAWGGGMETILVSQNNQALATGALVNGTSVSNIAAGQIGVLSWDHNGTTTMGNFLAPGDTVTNVAAIKVLQGTPNSAQLQRVEAWDVDHKADVRSGIISRNSVRSVSATKFRHATYGAYAMTDIPTILNDSEYSINIFLDSVKDDRDYSDNDNTIIELTETPNFTTLGTVDPLDWTIQNLLFKVNTRSSLVSVSNPAAIRHGNKNIVALAINSGGGAGQALGTIDCGTVVPVQRDHGVLCGNPINPVVTNVIGDEELIGALAHIIQKQVDQVAGGTVITNQITATSTIEVIDLTTAGTAANADAIILIGLAHPRSSYFDNVTQLQTRVDASLGQAFRISPLYKSTCCFPDEGEGQGWKWNIDSNDSYQLTVHTMQNQPFGEFFSTGVNYINDTTKYTSYIIDFNDFEETLTVRPEYPKQLVMLLEADSPCVTVADGVTNLAAGDNAILSTTLDAVTVAGLNATLGVWLESARQYTGHELLSDSTAAVYFV